MTIKNVEISSIEPRTATEISCEENLVATLGEIAYCYSISEYETDFQSYMDSFYDELNNDLEEITLESIIKVFVDSTKGETDNVVLNRERLATAFRISLYYCFWARVFYATSDDEQEAWFCIAHANKWLGTARAMIHNMEIISAEMQDLAQSKKEKAKTLADIRWDKDAEKRELARRLVKEYWEIWLKDRSRYKSQSEFAYDLQDRIEREIGLAKDGKLIYTADTIRVKLIPNMRKAE